MYLHRQSRMATHLAAVSHAKGESFELQTRRTPKPGPGELLIEVKSVALNPADGYMRDQGLFIPSYPAVLGFDVAGLVLEAGDNVPVSEGTDPFFDRASPASPRTPPPSGNRVTLTMASSRSAASSRGSMQRLFRIRGFLGTKRRPCPSLFRCRLARGMLWGSHGWEKPILLVPAEEPRKIQGQTKRETPY